MITEEEFNTKLAETQLLYLYIENDINSTVERVNFTNIFQAFMKYANSYIQQNFEKKEE